MEDTQVPLPNSSRVFQSLRFIPETPVNTDLTLEASSDEHEPMMMEFFVRNCGCTVPTGLTCELLILSKDGDTHRLTLDRWCPNDKVLQLSPSTYVISATSVFQIVNPSIEEMVLCQKKNRRHDRQSLATEILHTRSGEEAGLIVSLEHTNNGGLFIHSMDSTTYESGIVFPLHMVGTVGKGMYNIMSTIMSSEDDDRNVREHMLIVGQIDRIDYSEFFCLDIQHQSNTITLRDIHWPWNKAKNGKMEILAFHGLGKKAMVLVEEESERRMYTYDLTQNLLTRGEDLPGCLKVHDLQHRLMSYVNPKDELIVTLYDPVRPNRHVQWIYDIPRDEWKDAPLTTYQNLFRTDHLLRIATF